MVLHHEPGDEEMKFVCPIVPHECCRLAVLGSLNHTGFSQVVVLSLGMGLVVHGSILAEVLSRTLIREILKNRRVAVYRYISCLVDNRHTK